MSREEIEQEIDMHRNSINALEGLLRHFDAKPSVSKTTQYSLQDMIDFCYEKSKNIKLKAEPQLFIEIMHALETLKELTRYATNTKE